MAAPQSDASPEGETGGPTTGFRVEFDSTPEGGIVYDFAPEPSTPDESEAISAIADLVDRLNRLGMQIEVESTGPRGQSFIVAIHKKAPQAGATAAGTDDDFPEFEAELDYLLRKNDELYRKLAK